MKIRLYVLMAFVTIFVALNAFTPIALAESEIFESPQILADTDENFVLRDNINGTEKAYFKLAQPLEVLQNKSGNYTLYFMRDYTANGYSDKVLQEGSYTLLVRSAGKNTYTFTNTTSKHFTLKDFNINNKLIMNFENIILDGGQVEYRPKPRYEITIGGIDLYFNSQVTLGKGFVLKNCSDLGAGQNPPLFVHNAKSKLIIKDGAKFIHNITKYYPRYGLIRVTDGGSLQIDDAEFINNSSGKMGGIICCEEAGKASIKNSKFENNICDGEGVIDVSNGDLDLINCVFTGNQVNDFYSGTVHISGCNAKINDCKFYNNIGPDGGAIHASASPVSIKNCLFKGNYASTKYGGAIYGRNSSVLDIFDSDFFDNGKIKKSYYWEPETTYYSEKGGAIAIEYRASAKIKNCKFIYNAAYDGGAIFTEKYTRKTDSDDYTEIQDGDAYSNLTIDSDCVFKDNYSENGYFAPPLNFSDLNNLKFKSNSFTGKGYPYVLSLDKSLLNNYDVNYDFGAYIYTFNSNKGIFLDNTGSFHTDDSRYFTVRVNKGREYKISDMLPTFNKMIFVGWKDEEGVVHKAGEILPPADSNRVFKAVWEPYSGLVPQTGDTSNILLYSVLLAIATMTFVFITLKNKRKTINNKQ